MKILITAGPVFDYLDSVKIITNKFKGGSIALLADQLEKLGAEITYLCSKNTEKPEFATGTIIHHNGYEDYKNKVLELAPQHDAVILGAAVCNLIPNTPWRNTKFPSHLYEEGDSVNIEFTIAPRVINMVKKAAPKTTLIGFKLLSDATENELVEAAYDVLLNSGANFVIANDASDITKKLIVTKEKSAVPISMNDLAHFIYQAINDKYYRTWISDDTYPSSIYNHRGGYYWYKEVVNQYSELLNFGYDTKRNISFGCVAKKCENGFIISTRGKSSHTDEPTFVESVDHENRIIMVNGKKASLNAPLIDIIFKTFPSSHTIIHTHKIDKTLPIYDYAFPGTIRDSVRIIEHKTFTIAHHGSFYVY